MTEYIDFPLDIGCTQNNSCRVMSNISTMCESCRRDFVLRYEMDKLAYEMDIPYLPEVTGNYIKY